MIYLGSHTYPNANILPDYVTMPEDIEKELTKYPKRTDGDYRIFMKYSEDKDNLKTIHFYILEPNDPISMERNVG